MSRPSGSGSVPATHYGHAPAVRRATLVRSGALAALVVTYALALPSIHGLVGSPAFLLGLMVCLSGAAALGIRGALAALLCVVVIDRRFVLSLPPSAEIGRVAFAISLIAKLVLAGGLAWVVDSRRRVRRLNDELRHEIAAREHSEQSLRQSEALQRALVESLGEGVGLFDAQDRVVYANEALAEALHVPRVELTHRAFAEFLTAESQPTLSAEPSPAGARRSFEVAPRRSPGSLLLVTETRFEPSSSRAELTLRVVRDLTERVLTERRQRDLELELQRSQALQSLSVMAGGVAHDFNNLLCGVIGNAQLALRKVPPDAPPLLSHCLTEIRVFADEAAQLSKQMLAYAGRRSLAIGALEINAELSAALRLLQATVDSKARLMLELGEELPMVAADGFQLRQVVTNLVLNALDAMAGERGTLTLRTEALQLDAPHHEQYRVSPGHYVKVTVTDTGHGIAEEARARLFEPFFSTKGPGRGMGLAAAAGIVRSHRGWLGVEETGARGTSFSLLLPVTDQATQRPDVAPAATRVPPVSHRILLIDDEPAVRLVTGRLLTELGHQVVTAETGKRGVQILKERPDAFDLVVLDLTMPEQSGEQTLAQLRVVKETLPVVITSGFQVDDASMLLELPAVVGFLDKPHTLANLETVLAQVDEYAARVNAPSSRYPGVVPAEDTRQVRV